MTSTRPDRPPTPWSDTNEAECHHASHILEIVGKRWSPSILIAMARGAQRFTDIAAAIPGLSARMLTVRLKELETAGLVERTVIPTTPVTVRYRLTPQGIDLITAVQPIAGYVQRWEAGPGQAPSS
ncbi:helix-turn-helix domain-containing protein [Rhodococcus sovatensis]|uniref:Helix-turn-helix domain-containing protein n=1 Tax=Rhodococcus sovatensis TaxID=1805840 RepID=A0ABZ2PG87_9NOCA